MSSARSVLFRFADAAVIFFVCKNAAWSVIQNRYGYPPGQAQFFEWYGLAALYAVSSWASAASPRFPKRVRPLVKMLCFTGAVACFRLAWIQSTVQTGEVGVDSYDWAVLGLGFGCNALFQRYELSPVSHRHT